MPLSFMHRPPPAASLQVNPLTYQLPATAFITASVLNCLTVFFERNTNKYQVRP